MLHEEIKTLRNRQEDNKALRKGSFSRCKKKKASGVQCSSVVSAQVTCDLKQNQSNLNEISEDIKNLRCDLIDLIETRISASRQYVREVITSDINLLTNKIESLKDDVSYKKSTVTQWSEVTASRRKICSHTWHSESKPIPFTHNRN
jgi:hypothetical protein